VFYVHSGIRIQDRSRRVGFRLALVGDRRVQREAGDISVTALRKRVGWGGERQGGTGSQGWWGCEGLGASVSYEAVTVLLQQTPHVVKVFAGCHLGARRRRPPRHAAGSQRGLKVVGSLESEIQARHLPADPGCPHQLPPFVPVASQKGAVKGAAGGSPWCVATAINAERLTWWQ